MALEDPTSIDTNIEDSLEELAPEEMTAPMPEAPPWPPVMTVIQPVRRLRINTFGARNLRRNRGKHSDAAEQMTTIVNVKGALGAVAMEALDLAQYSKVITDCRCFYDQGEKETRTHIRTNCLVLDRIFHDEKSDEFFRLVLGTIWIKLNETEDGSEEVLYIYFYCNSGEKRSVACTAIGHSGPARPSATRAGVPGRADRSPVLRGVEEEAQRPGGNATTAHGRRATSRCRGSAACGRRRPGGWATSSTMGREPDADGLTSAVWVRAASAGLWLRHQSQ